MSSNNPNGKGFETTENTVTEGDNVGGQHFLLIPQPFTKPSLSRSLSLYHTISTFNNPNREVI